MQSACKQYFVYDVTYMLITAEIFSVHKIFLNTMSQKSKEILVAFNSAALLHDDHDHDDDP